MKDYETKEIYTDFYDFSSFRFYENAGRDMLWQQNLWWENVSDEEIALFCWRMKKKVFYVCVDMQKSNTKRNK